MIYRDRIDHEDRYVIAPRDWARDKRLSLKARGLLLELMSHKVGWQITVESLQSDKDGRAAVRSGIDELVEFGYLTMTRERNELGQVQGTDYVLGTPECDYPRVEKSAPVGVDYPRVGKSAPKKTSIEEELKEEHQGRAKSGYSEDFEAFWSVYPRKDGKQGTWNHYRKLIAAGETPERLLSAATGYADHVRREGTESRYVMVGYNWFGKGMWESYEAKQSQDVLVEFLAEHSFAELERATGIRCMTPEFGGLEFGERREAVKAFRERWLVENRDRLAEALR